MELPFGVFVLIIIAAIFILGSLAIRFTRPKEDQYATRIATGPSSLGVPVDPDEQAAAAAMGIRIKAQRDPKFAKALKQDQRAALLSAGIPEDQLDIISKRLGEYANDVDRRVERRFGSLTTGWDDKARDS